MEGYIHDSRQGMKRGCEPANPNPARRVWGSCAGHSSTRQRPNNSRWQRCALAHTGPGN